jgi:hypothetical protein
MKYLFIIISSVFCFDTSLAQNLINNPNFSSHSNCPADYSQIIYCDGWKTASGGTPDYFNACSSTILTDVPQNIFGYQVSASNAYAGIATYVKKSTLAFNYREYIITTFPPLLPGATYRVTITVSLSDSSYFASDGLGVLFSTNSSFYSAGYFCITSVPQINYSGYGVITDKTNWVTLTGDFIADSAYAALAIGNFKEDGVVTVVNAPSPASATSVADSLAFYYLDSVSVEKIADPTFASIAGTGKPLGLFPSPFTSNATFSFIYHSGEKYTLDICDLNGRVMRRIENITTSQIELERGNLPAGLYYYKLFGDGNSTSKGIFAIKDGM